MGKRVFLFITVNLLIIFTLSIVLQIFGIGYYLSEQGIDYGTLFAFCIIYGFTTSFISLAISRWIAKKMMGVKVIDPKNPQSGMERDLLQTVHRLSQKAGLPAMPEVGIYQSPEVNAFATGPSKVKSLVAVSSGLLERMNSGAVEGVLGHEVAHIANGDMVTMTLIQGVVNAFVMFFARIAAWAVSQAMRSEGDRGPSPMIHFMCVIVFEIAFGLLGAIVVAFFSRKREFRADSGSAQLAGREKMVIALESLKQTAELIDPGHQSVASLKIAGRPKGFAALLATHPALDDRIAALQNTSIKG